MPRSCGCEVRGESCKRDAADGVHRGGVGRGRPAYLWGRSWLEGADVDFERVEAARHEKRHRDDRGSDVVNGRVVVDRHMQRADSLLARVLQHEGHHKSRAQTHDIGIDAKACPRTI